MTKIIKICKIHGELKEDQIILNRISPKGKRYLRCKKCRNESENNRIKTKYLLNPRKHIKIKLPHFVTKENKSHAYTILNRFKITAIQYNEILKHQNNTCAICKNPETQKKRKSNNPRMLSIDHCHKTGKIRGLLCHQCNVGLCTFKDSIEYLESAINYLKNHL